MTLRKKVVEVWRKRVTEEDSDTKHWCVEVSQRLCNPPAPSALASNTNTQTHKHKHTNTQTRQTQSTGVSRFPRDCVTGLHVTSTKHKYTNTQPQKHKHTNTKHRCISQRLCNLPAHQSTNKVLTSKDIYVAPKVPIQPVTRLPGLVWYIKQASVGANNKN